MIGRRAGAALLAGHGLLHLVGVALLWRLGEPGGLRYADVAPVPGSGAGWAVGALWLAAAVLFAVAGAALLGSRPWWCRVTIGAVVVSCVALLPSASTAAAGLVVDWIVLVVAIMVAAGAGQPVEGRSPLPGVGAGLP